MAEIGFLTLANHAEVQNGLLNMLSAEWDTITRRYAAGSRPEPHRFSIALSVIVPWNETNTRHRVVIWIEDEDDTARVIETSLEIEVGRPAGRTPGSDTRAALAATVSAQFPQEGGYRVVAEVGGAARRTYPFRVVDRVVPV